MFWCVLTHVVAFLVDLITTPRRTDRDKDLQILYGSGTVAPGPGFP